MSYRNKTYVAFASEDIDQYWLMKAWKENQHIDFDFYDAHDLFQSRDTSLPKTIKDNLTKRLGNAKQVILLGSTHAKRKGSDGNSFLAHEIDVIRTLNLPIVVANLDGDRGIDRNFMPSPLLDVNYYTMSVSYQPKIIRYALDNYVPDYPGKSRQGPGSYAASIYQSVGL